MWFVCLFVCLFAPNLPNPSCSNALMVLVYIHDENTTHTFTFDLEYTNLSIYLNYIVQSLVNITIPIGIQSPSENGNGTLILCFSEVIGHPNHPLTRWLDPYISLGYCCIIVVLDKNGCQTRRFDLRRRRGLSAGGRDENAKAGWHSMDETLER